MAAFMASDLPQQPNVPTSRLTRTQLSPSKANKKSVYGKKRCGSTRAVLEDCSITSESQPPIISEIMKKNIEDIIDTVQERLADVKISDEVSDRPIDDSRHDSKTPSTDGDSLHEARTPINHPYETMLRVEVPIKEVEIATHPGVAIRQKRRQKRESSHPEETTSNKNGNNKDDKNAKRIFVDDEKAASYVHTILNEGMSSISRGGIQQFDKWSGRALDIFDVHKIAEGSYGEVYQLHVRDGISVRSGRLSKLRTYSDGVFKIVPLRAQSGAGSKKFTTVNEIVAEIQLLKLLDQIPGFARFREIHVVQGRFPPAYQAAWNKYSQTMDDCFNPDPSKKKSYPDNQLWAILEMENAGSELEKFKFDSVFQIYDVFWGITLALARAEQYACFEHRDLHLGNVCVKQKTPSRPLPKKLADDSFDGPCLGLSGLETTIIDYSLSRADLQPESYDMSNCNLEQLIAWTDLDRKEIFDAIGRDEDEKLLRNTYRSMRLEVYSDTFSGEQYFGPERWKTYNPRTNLVWLAFILATLLNKCRTKNLLPPRRQPLGERTANKNENKAKISKENRSESNLSQSAHSRTSAELQHALFERLETVQDLLELEDEYETLSSSGDLVSIAIGSQWLEESDFLC
ncbi:hypothetical protein FQN57_006009 [Myotisia sp. PD_48]|nr:hypothetical protein FQN57_006009 [Myotisia sp. PD_48]